MRFFAGKEKMWMAALIAGLTSYQIGLQGDGIVIQEEWVGVVIATISVLAGVYTTGNSDTNE